MSDSTQNDRWLDWGEGGVLLVAAPFLLFPTLKPGLTVVVLVLLCCAWLVRGLREKLFWPQTPLNGALLLWCIMIGVGIGVTAFPDLTLPKATGLFLGIAVWRYLVCFLNSSFRLRWALAGFAALGLAMAALGFLATNWPSKVPGLQALLAHIPASLLTLPEAPTAGVHANQLGGTLVLYFPLLLSLLVGWCLERGRLFWVVAGSVGLLGLGSVLLLTQSRSAWIGAWGSCIGILALWASMPLTKRRRGILWGLVGLLVLVSVVGLLFLGPERLANLIQEPGGMTAFGTLNTIGFRFEVWRWALAAIQDFPFTGCGLGAFRQVARLLYPLNVAPGYDIAHAHNIFLQVALDVGLPGLVAYLAMLGIVAVTTWRTAYLYANMRPLLLGILSGILALHIFGMTDALAPGSKPGLIFWYAVGLLSALYVSRDKIAVLKNHCGQENKDGRRDRPSNLH